jgi:hypothetical protein
MLPEVCSRACTKALWVNCWSRPGYYGRWKKGIYSNFIKKAGGGPRNARQKATPLVDLAFDIVKSHSFRAGG